MSQRERGPRVVSPLSSRNGNPTGPKAIRCVLLMPVLPHCKCWTACCSVLTIQVAENRPCSRLRFQLGIWVVPTSFCVEHHRHFLSRPFDRESRLFHSSYLTNSSCSILKWGTQVGHNSYAPLTMWTGSVVRRKAGTSMQSVQNNRPAFSSQSLLRWHQPVWWPGFEASFHNKAFHGRSCIHMGGVKQQLNPSPRNQPFLFPLNHLHVSGSHFPHSHGPFCPCSCPCSPRSGCRCCVACLLARLLLHRSPPSSFSMASNSAMVCERRSFCSPSILSTRSSNKASALLILLRVCACALIMARTSSVVGSGHGVPLR